MQVIELSFEGRLEASKVEELLDDIESRSRDRPFRLLVDCSRMKGYEADARRAFAHWQSKRGLKLDRTAIITTERMWHAMVTAMAVLVDRPMRVLDTRELALDWLHSDASSEVDAAPEWEPAGPAPFPLADSEAETTDLGPAADAAVQLHGNGKARGAASVRARGIGILTAVRAVQEQTTTKQWHAVLQALPPLRHDMLRGMQPTGWYPVGVGGDLYEAYRAACFPDDPAKHREALRDVGRFVADDNIESLLRLDIADMDVYTLVEHIPELWMRYYQGLEVEISLLRDMDAAGCRVRGSKGAKYLAHTASGWIERALERTGVTAPRVVVRRPASPDVIDTDHLEFRLSWRMPPPGTMTRLR